MHLSEALKTNKTLKELNLSVNEINSKNAKYVADALKVNRSITSLNLENNIFASATE